MGFVSRWLSTGKERPGQGGRCPEHRLEGSGMHSFIYSFIHSSSLLHPSSFLLSSPLLHPSTHPSVYLLTHPSSIHPLICLFAHLCTHLLVRLSTLIYFMGTEVLLCTTCSAECWRFRNYEQGPCRCGPNCLLREADH